MSFRAEADLALYGPDFPLAFNQTVPETTEAALNLSYAMPTTQVFSSVRTTHTHTPKRRPRGVAPHTHMLPAPSDSI